MRKMIRQVRTVAEQVQSGVRQAFRGVLNLMLSGDEIQKTQVSGLAGETLSDVELMQQFGFTSVPPQGTQAVILPIGGATTHGVVIATECGAFRVKNLQDGEVAVYDKSGSSIVLKQGRLIEIDCDVLKITASSKVDIHSPLVETDRVLTAQGQINGNGGMAVQGGSGASFTGNVAQSGGSFTTTGDMTASGKSFLAHTHKEQGDGAATSPPL
ncbi:phage baseplate assembly protein V [Lonepinella sp. BR2474]|uniref:phage baseplate assembly protein V n=1 Tax=unclassified Lonepinella TaxID=2642006 RepID=UPI003F6E01B1